jgi:hypothetical protein
MNQIRERALKPKYSYWIDRSGSNTLGSSSNNMNQIGNELETKILPGSIDLVAILFGKRHDVITINPSGTSLKPKYSYWIDRSGSNTLETRGNRIKSANELETKSIPTGSIDLVAILLGNGAM